MSDDVMEPTEEFIAPVMPEAVEMVREAINRALAELPEKHQAAVNKEVFSLITAFAIGEQPDPDELLGDLGEILSETLAAS
jgi:hypothetical protein